MQDCFGVRFLGEMDRAVIERHHRMPRYSDTSAKQCLRY